MDNKSSNGFVFNAVKLLNKIRIHYFGEVTSALDIGWDLIRQDRLDIFDSVIVKTQTEGRGQMRRKWISPPGNLYAAFRLPFTAPFNQSCGAVATAGIILYALKKSGYDTALKWPNDIVVKKRNTYAKCGGILVEERNEALLAGFGLDLNSAPEIAHSHADMSAAVVCRKDCLQPDKIWLEMLKHIIFAWCSTDFPGLWRKTVEDNLIWKNKKVNISYGDNIVSGVFTGLSNECLPVIFCNGESREVQAQSMHLASDD